MYETIPLVSLREKTRAKRAKKAINYIREKLRKKYHAEIKITNEVNEELWKRSIKKIPTKIKIFIKKEKERVIVYLKEPKEKEKGTKTKKKTEERETPKESPKDEKEIKDENKTNDNKE